MGLPVRAARRRIPLDCCPGRIGGAPPLRGAGRVVCRIGCRLPGPNRRRARCRHRHEPGGASRIRRTLNVESGLNDGIVAPLVSLAVAVLVGESSGTHAPLVHALREICVGALVGVGGPPGCRVVPRSLFAGVGQSRALFALRRRRPPSVRTRLPLPCTARLRAAFLAGLCFGISAHHLGGGRRAHRRFGASLACVVWFASAPPCSGRACRALEPDAAFSTRC